MIEYDPEQVPEEKDFKPVPKGVYESEIIDANAMQSKAGNDMLRLNFLVTSDKGNTTRIYDYIVIPNTLFKLKSICRCLNMDFDGTLDEKELIGQRLKVEVSIEKGKDGYKDRNKIDKYIDGINSDTTPEKTPDVPDDDIPF